MEQIYDLSRELVNSGFGRRSLVMFVQKRPNKKAHLTHHTANVYRQIAESNNETGWQPNEKTLLLEKKVSGFIAIITAKGDRPYVGYCPDPALKGYLTRVLTAIIFILSTKNFKNYVKKSRRHY